MKRVFDITCSFLLFIILSPLFLIIACAVRLTSPGPVIFRSPRVGHQKRVFTMLKFRTMQDGTGDPSEILAGKDPRITAVGRILRPTHLDELPQLWNVLRGEMSLVGPRPYTPEISAIYMRINKRFNKRFDVHPGMTGLEQIHGRRQAINRGPYFTIALDALYVMRQNFLFDLAILLRTIPAVLKRQGI